MTLLAILAGIILGSYIMISLLFMAFRNIGIIVILIVILGCFGTQYLGTHRLPTYDEVFSDPKK